MKNASRSRLFGRRAGTTTPAASKFRVMREKGATEIARTDTRLIMGGWTHNYALNFVGASVSARLARPTAPAWEPSPEFYDRHLRGAECRPRARALFRDGESVWRDADDWPIPGTDFRRMYLHSKGSANSNQGDGALSLDVTHGGSESPDRITSDPMDPVPSWGFRVMYTGGTTVAGPFEQMRVEQRKDVSIYTSEPLSEAWEVVGDIDLHLYVSSTARTPTLSRSSASCGRTVRPSISPTER